MKTTKQNKSDVIEGSGNVFADLGFGEESPELQAKASLTHLIHSRIRALSLTQAQAGSRLNLAQPDISKLMNGRFSGFSVDRLIALLNALEVDVEIVVRPHPARARQRRGTFSVREAVHA
jgi:predicted XRE-type DNA-binding protein